MMSQTGVEWRNGWSMVVTAFFCYGVGGSYPMLTTLFIGPIEQELGWSRMQITAGLMLVSVASVLGVPFVGPLVDRWGSRSIGLPGMIIYCGSLALLYSTSSEIWHWLALWALVAVGVLLTQGMIWVTAVSKRFDRTRGVALAVVMCGSGAVTGFFALLLNWVIQHHGWRAAYLTYGGVGALLTVPLIVMFFHDAGRNTRNTVGHAVAQPLEGIGVKEAILSRAFLRIAIITLLMTSSLLALNVHFLPLMMSLGV